MAESLAQPIKTEARRLGFDLAGITTPDPPPHWSVYENWLAMGRHARMAYLADERARTLRLDPRRILSECRSILVLGIRYSSPNLHSPLGFEGGIASYAWGEDYHLVLPERLRTLVAFIETQAGHPIPNRWYSDSGPILERDLAQRAGLGWIGKNTCLINPRLGSYFLLAEILLGIQLEPDPPFESDRCGTCTRCIQACPTQCILPDRTLDARRCISYLTIELEGDIPPNLRPLLDDWVFGCDVCQMVCPWNRFAEPMGDPAFAPRPGVAHPDLAAELSLTPEAFSRKFKNSPVKRAKRGGYLRNVAVALGNAGDPAAAPALEQALHDPDPLVRSHAAWALERIRCNEKRDACLGC
ncbi:MAG: tRNA epoxyqueuosine(34) reductase QueG [Chloroflexi bacterium]|nr:tRNA epoxyqueuosine(34) reductase QueG [Chloroflexota bacterium]